MNDNTGNDINDVTEAQTWAEMAGPIIAKLHASSALGLPVNITPDGCKALALMLANMARKLDQHEGNYPKEGVDNLQ